MSKKLRNNSFPLSLGFKIYPEDIAGMIGLPYVGTVFYVDPINGNDGNDGLEQDTALKTVKQAESLTTENKHDVVIEVPIGNTGGTGRTVEANAIAWTKDRTHLIGNSAPSSMSQRAGMEFSASVATGLTVSADGCIISNITIATFADNNGLVEVTGSRNVFSNVHLAGIGNATAGDDANARVLYMNGGQENDFNGCTFGLDTIMRSTTNATLEFASAASRNRFTACDFVMAADNVGPNHVLFTGTSAIDRWVSFEDCSWYAFWTNDADKVTHAFDLAAQSATGHVLMKGKQLLVGFDDWEAVDSGRMYFEPHSATANAIGIGINPSVS